ncbi:MAG: inositol monophosphatase [Planctomycetes bacterium]|nr:inositol monophosphatase [Planctomycetota bacterium]
MPARGTGRAKGAPNIESRAIHTLREIAETAGRHLMGYFGSALTPRPKTRTSFVTEADESTERLIREALAGAFGAEAVLGEEFGLGAEPDGAWWVIDPIDGTSNFVAGVPLFCVSIARIEERRTVMAVTHDPNTGETYHAVRGEGAYLGDHRLTIDATDRGALTLLAIRHSLIGRHPQLPDQLPTDKLRSLGTACLELAYIAASRIQGMIARRIHLWDFAAGALLVEEAGGVVHSAGGRPLFPLEATARDYQKLEVPLVAGTPCAVALLESVVRLD